MTFLFEAYTVNKKGNIVLKLHPKLAPVKVAILPLVKKDAELLKIAREVYDNLKNDHNIAYDASGSVGRRYARNDEIGTPFCITIDSDSIKNRDATIRNRDDGEQKRVPLKDVKEIIRKLISSETTFKEI